MVSVNVKTGSQVHQVWYREWKGKLKVENPNYVVCWHGLARNSHDFDILAQYMVKNMENVVVIVPDTPGRGKSEKLEDASLYHLQSYVNVFVEIFKEMGCPEKIDWVGISMGGLIGMVLSAYRVPVPLPASSSDQSPVLRPITIRKLVLVDIGPFISEEAVFRIGSYVGTEHHWSSLSSAESHLKTIYSQMGDDITPSQWQWISSFLTKQENSLYSLHYDPLIALAFKSRSVDDLPSDSTPAAAEIPADTKKDASINLWPIWDLIPKDSPSIMLYHGELSDVLTFDTVKKMQETGPGLFKLLSFPQYGHTPHFFSLSNCLPILQWFSQ